MKTFASMNDTYLKMTITETHTHLIHQASAHQEEVVTYQHVATVKDDASNNVITCCWRSSICIWSDDGVADRNM
jgi:hypothetical protein